MADNTAHRVPANRSKINIYSQRELAYWTDELGVDGEQLRDAVERVGVMASDVRNALGQPSATRGLWRFFVDGSRASAFPTP